jgi:hypothetical protein
MHPLLGNSVRTRCVLMNISKMQKYYHRSRERKAEVHNRRRVTYLYWREEKVRLRLIVQRRHGWVTTLIVCFQASTGLCDVTLFAIGRLRT